MARLHSKWVGNLLRYFQGSTAILDIDGDNNCIDAAAMKLAGTQIAATAAEINRNCDASGRLVAAGSALTVTEALHDGKIIKLDTATGSTCTLPAATGSGARFRFVVAVIATSNNHIVKVANASDTIAGTVSVVDTDTAGTVTGFATAATSDTITLNRGTSGSVTVGEWLELVDIVPNVWAVRGVLSNTGGGATPFSAAVN